jgi:PAB-dependent poly(A)-specific ribonuclease subunit 3
LSSAHLLAHHCLLQLDAGSEERIMLVARDEQSCIVASYKEIKDIAESAFKYVSALFHEASIL